jgi:hypothetical protein
MKYYRLYFKMGPYPYKKGEFHHVLLDWFNCEYWEILEWKAWSNTLRDYKWKI